MLFYRSYRFKIEQIAHCQTYFKGKVGLDTVGSVQTVQAVGPDGPTLSPEQTKYDFKTTFEKQK